MSQREELLQVLRGPLEQVFARSEDELAQLASLLHAPVPPPPVASEPRVSSASALFEYGRQMIADGKIVHLSFDGPLISGASTPISLDGVRYASLESLYHCLKLPEGSAERAACAAATAWEARRLTRRLHTASFGYQGKELTVGSAEHAALIARAVAAKVEQHVEVQDALHATGRALLIIRASHRGVPLNVLGRVNPLALMLERWRRFG
ncbi:MAG TPA: hypothetical protein PKU97_10375 [Kofleriaceae bacterium]|nr:hypothetical protein [Kofleriaceae bacterium]